LPGAGFCARSATEHTLNSRPTPGSERFMANLQS
jgi:hypothetical protein